MCIVECKEKWKDSGEYHLYFSSTLLKTALRRDTGIAENFYFVPCFQNQACPKLNTSLTLETNVKKKLYTYILSRIFPFSLGKRVHNQCYQKPLSHCLYQLPPPDGWLCWYCLEFTNVSKSAETQRMDKGLGNEQDIENHIKNNHESLLNDDS